jgi:tryptophan 2,3-dioxygenase
MLNGEHGESVPRNGDHPLTYSMYLRVPELLELQTPLKVPGVHDEMLFIIVQQVQELWFKQVLHELHDIIELMSRNELLEAVRLISRVNRIMGILGDEVDLLATMPPQQFQHFRHVLETASGFESHQFREVEMASGLSDPTFLKLIEKHMDGVALHARWPQTLHDAFLAHLRWIDADPVAAVVRVYNDPQRYAAMYTLAEALSEYEVLFSQWRFHHIKAVERTLGDRALGTAGTGGVGYLGRTLGYRFFPELWEARNHMAAVPVAQS